MQGWARHKSSNSNLSTFSKSPPRSFLIFLDFSQAYNSVNLELLEERMLKDKILDRDKTKFLFFLYRRLKIHLGEYSYEPVNGVPQGGVNSPLLFSFCMNYLLTDSASRISERRKSLEQTRSPPRAMSPETNFVCR
ncbi:MAG TPA: reverse transcriptase domain-containing protein [Candidatus Dojkabacteria bacterium]|nr:reverse transcriptase domain-containing protein [Candidatus Dojkabacteria bacterium]